MKKIEVFIYFILFLILFITIIRMSTIITLDHITYNPVSQVVDYDILKNKYLDKFDNIFINNVPKQYKLQFAIVCSKFSELKNENISFEFDKIKTTMQALPKLNILFGNRKYSIIMNNDIQFDGIKFDDIPFNAQIGIISHELCHILDYKYKSIFEIIGTGLFFLSKEDRALYEQSIDLLTVKKGFGYQLKDWSNYAIYESKASESYKKFKSLNYLRPEEIEILLEK